MLCNTRAHTLRSLKALPDSFGLLSAEHFRGGEDYKEVVPGHALLFPRVAMRAAARMARQSTFRCAAMSAFTTSAKGSKKLRHNFLRPSCRWGMMKAKVMPPAYTGASKSHDRCASSHPVQGKLMPFSFPSAVVTLVKALIAASLRFASFVGLAMFSVVHMATLWTVIEVRQDSQWALGVRLY